MAVTVYATKAFSRFTGKADLEDGDLLAAAQAVMAGRFDADLGGGKSGGLRTILLFRVGGPCIFAHGFAKNEKANVSVKELTALKQLAATLLGLSAKEIETAVQAGELRELVGDDGDENQQED